MDNSTIISLVIWLLFSLWGWHIGKGKDHPIAGALLGFFLGIIGVLIIYIIPDKTKTP